MMRETVELKLLYDVARIRPLRKRKDEDGPHYAAAQLTAAT